MYEDRIAVQTSFMGGSPSSSNWACDQPDKLRTLQEDICDCQKRKQRSENVAELTEVMDLCPEEYRKQLSAVDISQYEFPFENLVFEGGGSKCIAHIGALQVLQEAGIMARIKRVAGTSLGAVVALNVALDFTAAEIEALLTRETFLTMKPRCIDCCSFLPNVLCKYGWRSMDDFDNHLGKIIAAKTGNADISFREVYERTGKELCIAVLNANMMVAEYFHMKTTPTMPVRLAVRASVSVPVLYQPSWLSLNGTTDMYVDGGVFANYPIYCFDGWWLSGKPEDAFLQKMQPLSQGIKFLHPSERFGSFNNKTLGFRLYSTGDSDVLDMTRMDERTPIICHTPPSETKLARKRREDTDGQKMAVLKNMRYMEAVDAFIKVLAKHDCTRDGYITQKELRNALRDEEAFPHHYVERLFGNRKLMSKVFNRLDRNRDGKVHYHELMSFIQSTGVSVSDRLFGYGRMEITGLWSYLKTFVTGLRLQSENYTDRDLDRTVGINTAYVRTLDMSLEQADKDFLIERGRCYTDAYLRRVVLKNKPPKVSKMARPHATRNLEDY